MGAFNEINETVNGTVDIVVTIAVSKYESSDKSEVVRDAIATIKQAVDGALKDHYAFDLCDVEESDQELNLYDADFEDWLD